MKKEEYIQKQVDETLEIGSQFSDVKISRQFKEKVMSRLFTEKKQLLFSWFTPKLQFATLAMVLVINCSAILYNTNASYNSNVDSFAQQFNLSSTDILLN